MLTLPNYQTNAQIYESADSIVYRGIKKQDNQSVILKVLKEDYPTQEELTRYRQEYEITHDLDLTGVIKTYGIEKYQNTLVIILEDFGGESLKTIFEKGEPWKISISNFLSLAIQIADALSQIHAANIIHKDINPANIIWNQTTNQLKIIDFGIASRLPRENLTLKNPEQLEGTLAYLSPEQTGRINRSMDYRTDLYSLGISFYELLSGQLPFTTTDTMELVHCHIAKTPTSLCDVNPDIPPIISDIVMKLLAKNAEDRYQSAFGIKADLEKCLENLPDFKNLTGLSFKLAQNDFSGKFQIPKKLYGREHEIDTLLTTFERVVSGKTEIMLVAGYSGIGKSVLVKEIYKSLTEKQGYFIAGKFDQFQRNIPYSAIFNAFRELVQQLLTENEAQLSHWKTKLLEAINPNGQVMTDVIPEIELIIGKQPPVPQLGSTESQNRFNLVFQNFIRVFCQPEHPLVIFIDDLQWVDSATLRLLSVMTTDSETQALFLIGAFRDNEVDSAHPLMMTLEQLSKENVIINQMTLKSLCPADINQLIADTLAKSSTEVDSLTNLVMHKTGGNPFFVNQFLHTLYEENLLKFKTFEHSQTSSWHWDIAQIEAMDITDNVVELMLAKLKKLPQSTQYVLRLAACIGNRFDLNTLSIIYEKSAAATLQELMPVLSEELILPIFESEMSSDKIHSLQFLHDRVQQAAYSLISKQHHKTLHLQIGRLLLSNTEANNLAEKIFEIVNQFQLGIELITDEPEKLKVAELNLIAGKRAKDSTAYIPAWSYFKAGLSLLSEKHWETHYALMMSLHVESTETAYLNSELAQVESLFKTVLKQATTPLEKVKVYQVRIQAHQSVNDGLQATLTGLEILEILGLSLPKRNFLFHSLLEIIKTKWILKNQPLIELEHLPMMEDQTILAIMQIMTTIIPSTNMSLPTLLPVIACKMVQLSIQYGNSPYTPFGYNMYSIVMSKIGDLEKVRQLGQLSPELMNKYPSKEIRPYIFVTRYYILMHWNHPIRTGIQPLIQEAQNAYEIGNLEFLGYCLFFSSSLYFLSGENLEKLVSRQIKWIDSLKKYKQDTSITLFKPYTRLCFLLLGKDEHTLFSESLEDLIPLLEKEENLSIVFRAYLALGFFNYYFGHYEEALAFLDSAQTYIESMVGMPEIPIHNFYTSLSILRLSKMNFKKKYRIMLNQKKLKKWAKYSPKNYQHKYDLVEAERARVLGKIADAEKLYEQAIQGAKENEYIQEQAIACELAGQFFLERQIESCAKTYLKEAHYVYGLWGAKTKVADLEQKYPQFYTQINTQSVQTNATVLATKKMDSASTYSSSNWLDLNSVVKASHTLSGEIVLSRLLEKMMHFVIENAGAETGFLLLPKQNDWLIEAEGHVDSDKVAVLQSLAIETNEQLPTKIIHYVARTQENVILHDATQEGRFTHEPYIVKQRPKSILCVPLLNQGQLNGILYLENNLTTGAFTQGRIEVLNLLSSQIAISIKNANLYTNMTQLNRAYERFVPHGFLSLLDKQSIIDVQLGDQVEKEMTVLFSDIRDFTSLSEKLTPQDNFEFINAYLGQMEPIIHQYQGIIDKYIGDAIMALFPTSADNALKGAIAMLKTLEKYNQILQYTEFEAIRIGIGLHTGKLMLGTIGGQNRMDGTVISDAVNLASRIEGLTKTYHIPLLITENTYQQLTNPNQYKIRVIDRVTVKGKIEPVTIYEVFETQELIQIELKLTTLADFEQGFHYFHNGQFELAQNSFEKVLQVNSDDKVAQIYAENCRKVLGIIMPKRPIILIVDDIPSNIKVLFTLLKTHHFELLIAEDGEAALETVLQKNPHLILLDVMMPEMNGFEVCQRLKENPKTQNIPVIFTTALAATEDKIKGFQLGAVDYITKPYQPEEVLSRIKTHLMLSFLQQQLQAQNVELEIQNVQLKEKIKTLPAAFDITDMQTDSWANT